MLFWYGSCSTGWWMDVSISFDQTNKSFFFQVCEIDVSKQLQAYEVEYHVLQDELLDTPPSLNQQQRAAQLERTNQSLRQQNLDLLEELQVQPHTHTHGSPAPSSVVPPLSTLITPLFFSPGVPCSCAQSGDSTGGSGPVRGSSERASVIPGGGETSSGQHSDTSPGPSHHARPKQHPGWTHTPYTYQQTNGLSRDKDKQQCGHPPVTHSLTRVSLSTNDTFPNRKLSERSHRQDLSPPPLSYSRPQNVKGGRTEEVGDKNSEDKWKFNQKCGWSHEKRNQKWHPWVWS